MKATTSIGKYLNVVAVFPTQQRKTLVWRVVNKTQNATLGTIKWEPGLRQYVYAAEDCAIYSAGCLHDIERFLTAQNQAHKTGAKA